MTFLGTLVDSRESFTFFDHNLTYFDHRQNKRLDHYSILSVKQENESP